MILKMCFFFFPFKYLLCLEFVEFPAPVLDALPPNLQKCLAVISNIFCSILYSFVTSIIHVHHHLNLSQTTDVLFFQTVSIFYFSLDNFCPSIFKFTKLFICSVQFVVNLIQWILKLKYSSFHLVVELSWFFFPKIC